MLIILNPGDCFSYCNTFILKAISFEITDYRNLADNIFPTTAQLFGPSSGRISKSQLSVRIGN